jgi:hypothetical protein
VKWLNKSLYQSVPAHRSRTLGDKKRDPGKILATLTASLTLHGRPPPWSPKQGSIMARITVKAISHDIEGEPETPLLSVLREQLGLAGADVAAKKAQPAADGSRAGPSEVRFFRNASRMISHARPGDIP